MPKMLTVKQYKGEYSGSQEIDINVDKIWYIQDRDSNSKNKSNIFFTDDFYLSVAPTRKELRQMIESLDDTNEFY